MAKNVIQSTILSINGGVSVAPGASIEIRNAASGQLVPLWRDRNGTQSATNPTTADANGFFRVYTDAGRVHITARKDGKTQEWRDVLLGSAAGYDVGTEPDRVPTNALLGAPPRTVASIAALRALEVTDRPVQVESQGLYHWRAGDQSANVAADTGQTVWVAPATDPIGAQGAWQLDAVDTLSLPTGWTVWEPPAQPPARVDHPGYFADGFNWTAEQFIAQLWEPLRAAAPDYITRETLGLDQSGTYNVYRYAFTPPHYDRTLVVTAAMHGGEVLGMLALYRLLYHVVHDWRQYPQLAHLRWRTRLIVIPIVNPWGVSQSPRTRQNSNGVDLNRNFDYRWDSYPANQPFDHDYKGVAAFSEIEARYVRDTLSAYPEALAYLDLHNYGSGTQHYPIYVPAEYPDGSDIVSAVVAALRKPGEIVDHNRSYNPSGYTYAAAEYGMYASNPEWADGVSGGSIYSGTDITAALRWYANLIIAYSYAPQKAIRYRYLSPRCLFAYWSGSTSLTWTNTTYTELSDLRITFPVHRPGYVKVTGVALVQCSDPAANVFVLPRVGQYGYGQLGPAASGDWVAPGWTHEAEWEVYSSVDSTSARRAIPFVAAVPVFPTGHGREEVSVGLQVKTDAGTAMLRRYRAMIEFVPADQGDERMEVYTANGREGTGVGAMQRALPAY